MKAIILGCGGSAGMPQIGGPTGHGDWGACDPTHPRNRRTRPSLVIETPTGHRLLIDTGPDLRLQLTTLGIPRIDAVLYTHGHADHIAGLDEIRILNRILGAPMPAYATAATWSDLQERFTYAFRPHDGGFFSRPVLHPHTIAPGETIQILGHPITLFAQHHGATTTLGLRIKNLAYCTDVAHLNPTALAALQGIETFIIDCFSHLTPHPTHANLPQVQQWITQLTPTRTILTHMGPDMDYPWLTANLPKNIEPAYDGLVIEF